MQLYKTTAQYDDGEEPSSVSWQGSATEASKARTALKARGLKKPISQTVQVPTAKGPLLEWLNANVKV